MPKMAIKRRTFLATLGIGLLPLRLDARALGSMPQAYLSCRGDASERFYVSGFSTDGTALFDLPLPARGHSLAVHPSLRQVLVFARRPGTFARIIDPGRGKIVGELESEPGRHFCGHGVYTPDGEYLYATENDYERERGVLGIYAVAQGYHRVGELPSYGIDPHDVRLLSDGTTLLVANGGIITHPDLPRVKLNIPTMDPSLVYLDRRDGRLLARLRLDPELHQLSIRHLSVAADDRVAIAMQYEGPQGNRVPLVARHRLGDAKIALNEATRRVWQGMQQYGGSVAFDSSGGVLAVSSPRGGVIELWDAAGRHLRTLRIVDGCGIAATGRPGEFLASSGEGGVFRIDAGDGVPQPIKAQFTATKNWDNHLVPL